MIPQDLAGIDRLLAERLGDGRAAANRSSHQDMQGPAMQALAQRIFVASRSHLPGAEPLATIGPRSVPVSASLRWARVAFAAAAAVAVAAATVLALRHEGSRTAVDPTSLAAGDGSQVPSQPGPGNASLEARSSAPEATLVALLDTASLAAADGRWIDEDALAVSAAGRSVVPVLQTRGSAIDDFENELGAILGSELGAGRSAGGATGG